MEREFFRRPATEVAPGLLGCVLEHETAAGLVAVRVTEVEAYMGAADSASHAYRGRTQRNAVMFGPPGYAYVYFTYGMHFCVNLVCSPEGTASAVLLRAGQVIAGEELARERRASAGRASAGRASAGRSQLQESINLASGPARLCQALDIDRSLDGADVCAARSALRVRGTTDRYEIKTGPRVGVSTAAEVAWRYWIAGDPTVSAYRAHVPRRPKPVTPSPA
jgi:DNA-3-methyladenine glycosylase